jgi:hypothetical protein
MRRLMRASRTAFRRARSADASIGRFGNFSLMTLHTSNASDPMIIFFILFKFKKPCLAPSTPFEHRHPAEERDADKVHPKAQDTDGA